MKKLIFLLGIFFWGRVFSAVLVPATDPLVVGKNNPEFVAAAAAGDIAKVRHMLVYKNVDINSVDENGDTALHAAIENGHDDIANLLLGDAFAKKSDNDGQSGKNIDYLTIILTKVSLLLKKIDLDAQNSQGNTPLHLAALKGHDNIIKKLVNLEAKLLIENQDKNRAKELDSNNIISGDFLRTYVRRMIVEASMSPDDYSTTLFNHFSSSTIGCLAASLRNLHLCLDDIASEGCKKGIQCFYSFVKDKIDAAVSGLSVPNAFHEAVLAKKKLLAAILADDINFVKYALDLIKNINEVLEYGYANRPALHFASALGRTEIVKLLLERGADVALKTAKGFTPLKLALANYHYEVVAMLTQKSKLDSETQEDIVNFLLNTLSKCPNDIAIKIIESAKLVNRPSILVWAIVNGKKEIVDFLVGNGALFDVVVKWTDLTPLHAAALIDNKTLVEEILSKVRDKTYIERKCCAGLNALHLAILAGRNNAITALLDHGADPVEPDIALKWSPLFMAVAVNNKEVVAKLLQRKEVIVKSLKDVDVFGNTLLHIAALNGNVEIFKLLAAKNLANTKNVYGHTWQQIAREIGWPSFKEMLGGQAMSLASDNVAGIYFLFKFFKIFNVVRDMALKSYYDLGNENQYLVVDFDLLNREKINGLIDQFVNGSAKKAGVTFDKFWDFIAGCLDKGSQEYKSSVNGLFATGKTLTSGLLGPAAGQLIDVYDSIVKALAPSSSMQVTEIKSPSLKDEPEKVEAADNSIIRRITTIFSALKRSTGTLSQFSDFGMTSTVTVPIKITYHKSFLPALNLFNLEKTIKALDHNRIANFFNIIISTGKIKELCGLPVLATARLIAASQGSIAEVKESTKVGPEQAVMLPMQKDFVSYCDKFLRMYALKLEDNESGATTTKLLGNKERRITYSRKGNVVTFVTDDFEPYIITLVGEVVAPEKVEPAKETIKSESENRERALVPYTGSPMDTIAKKFEEQSAGVKAEQLNLPVVRPSELSRRQKIINVIKAWLEKIKYWPKWLNWRIWRSTSILK